MRNSAKAESIWDRAAHAYQHYLNYIKTKQDRFSLSTTDLVYVKNFKGGSAVIGEPSGTLGAKLMQFECAFRDAAGTREFRRSLRDLDDDEYARARERMVAVAKLSQSPSADINGFGVSFASTLFHFYFPTLVPILDRRVLNGACIEGIVVDTQNQVKNLLELYPALIDYFRDRVRDDAQLTLRSLDRLLFVLELRRPPFRNRR